MLGTHVSHNHQLIPKELAAISIGTIEWTYGFGVYEHIRFDQGKPRFAKEHVRRLFHSAKIIGLEHHIDVEDIEKDIGALLEANAVETGNIKIFLIGGKSADDAQLYIFLLPRKFLDRTLYRDGVSVITKQYERFLPEAKTLNMLPSYLFYREAEMQGAYDTLLVNRDGCMLEGTRSNFFAIQGKTLVTAPPNRVLRGVTREHVIASALAEGYSVKEEMISSADIFSFDGLFLTNTSHGVVPIRAVDEKLFGGISEEFRRFRKVYEEYVEKLEESPPSSNAR